MAKKILNIVISILTVIIFMLTVLILIFGTITVKQGKMIKVFGYSYSVVVTDSMKGTIEVGDMILIKCDNFAEATYQDIVVFYWDINNDGVNERVVHRVTEISDDKTTLITRGDNPIIAFDDVQEVTKDNYIGKVVKYGNIGIGNIILNYRNYVFGAIALIFGYLIISQIISIIKIKNEKDKEAIKLQNEKDLAAEKEKLKEEILAEISKEDEEQK